MPIFRLFLGDFRSVSENLINFYTFKINLCSNNSIRLQTAGGGDKPDKSKQRDEQSSNNQGKTGATQTKTGGSPSAAATATVGDTVTAAAASAQIQSGNNK